ncbi:MAG: alanine dehydrogenase [Bacteroidia bacterium]|nr:alanine dehydrogenase [Bacteroidia bacterium]
MDSGKGIYLSGIHPSLLTTTQEKPLKVSKSKTTLRIGVPKETVFQEKRVSLTPGSVGVLTANGHQVIVEHNAGLASQFTDKDYAEVGAQIAYSTQDVYARSDIIVKIAPLTLQELSYLQPKQILISAVHLGTIQPDYIRTLINKNITAIGFEFMQAEDGSIPIMRMISEIAGITSVHIAAELLSGPSSKGVLLGGITGVPPAIVTIIGAGSVGLHAAKTAIGLGATVKVIDEEIHKLRRLEEILGRKIYTAVAQQDYITEAVASADVVIGAIYKKGMRTPCVVSEEMVASMREGSVIVDVSIDQGGCIETSEVTNHDSPIFVKHGVIHYCVPNIASRVARTASQAISNVLGPLVIKIGEAGGINNLLSSNRSIKRGIYTYSRHLTQHSLAQMFGMDYIDIDLLFATDITG